MPDFERPQYQSYIALCRQLMLPRLGIATDAYWYESKDVTGHVRHSSYPAGRIQLTERNSHATSFWLPSTTDWLDLLKEHDHHSISFVWHGNWTWHPQKGRLPALDDWSAIGYGTRIEGRAPSREEATARLYLSLVPSPRLLSAGKV